MSCSGPWQASASRCEQCPAGRSRDNRTDRRPSVKWSSISASMPASQYPRRRERCRVRRLGDGEHQERADWVTRNEPGKQGCDHADDRTHQGAGRSRAPLPRAHAYADAGRKTTTAAATAATCIDRHTMQPRLSVNDRTRGRRRQRRSRVRCQRVSCGLSTRCRLASASWDSRLPGSGRLDGPASFNPTVGGVTGTDPRYSNRSRRRTASRSPR